MKLRTIQLVLLCACLLGADAKVRFEAKHLEDGATPRAILGLMASGQLREAADAFWLPAAYSDAQRASELRQLARALAATLGDFGTPSAIEPARAAFNMVDITVGSGPQPAWWLQEPGYAETRKYVYRAHFSKYGLGYLVVATGVQESERVVGVSFGLPSRVDASQARISQAFSRLLDIHGVPADHPVRKQSIPIREVPAAAER